MLPLQCGLLLVRQQFCLIFFYHVLNQVSATEVAVVLTTLQCCLNKQSVLQACLRA